MRRGNGNRLTLKAKLSVKARVNGMTVDHDRIFVNWYQVI